MDILRFAEARGDATPARLKPSVAAGKMPPHWSALFGFFIKVNRTRFSHFYSRFAC